MNYYAGIGAREIPEDIRKELIKIGATLASKGYILRSGGAQGADSAFERGCDLVKGSKEIFLPWKNFNDSQSPFFLTKNYYDLEPIAKTIYLNWDNVSIGVRKMHARNVQQILGNIPGQDQPVDFVVCWTNRPADQFGGTRFGMRLAEARSIPVYNLYEELDRNRFYDLSFMK